MMERRINHTHNNQGAGELPFPVWLIWHTPSCTPSYSLVALWGDADAVRTKEIGGDRETCGEINYTPCTIVLSKPILKTW